MTDQLVLEDQTSHLSRLVLFSGPPGVGKSTLSYALSRHTGWAVIAKDGLDRTLELEEHGPWPPITAYRLMLDIADLNLRNGASIILDAVFPRKEFRDRAAEIAERHGALLCVVVCRCGDPILWQHRVEARPEMVSGWTPADWSEARRVETQYEPWSIPHLTLDAVDPLPHNITQLIGYVTE